MFSKQWSVAQLIIIYIFCLEGRLQGHAQRQKASAGIWYQALGQSSVVLHHLLEKDAKYNENCSNIFLKHV